MPGKLVHFEIPADDAARATEFYGSLFGWTFQSWNGPIEYHMTEAGGDPGGAVYPSQAGERGPIVYFDTDDVEATVARVRELGGTAEDPRPIPGVGWYSHCVDTEGNRFGVFVGEESAPGADLAGP